MRRLFVLLLVLIAPIARAQTVRGVVRDSSTQAPVPGAIVIVLDSARLLVTRTVTNGRGEYELPRAPEARFIRTLRLGFRPRELSVPASAAPTLRVDIGIVAIPVTLQTRRTIAAASCPRRKDAEAALSNAHITCNKNSIPNDPEKPFVTSGIRLGSPAITTRGFTELESEELAHIIADVLEAPGDETAIEHARASVRALTHKFPVYG